MHPFDPAESEYVEGAGYWLTDALWQGPERRDPGDVALEPAFDPIFAVPLWGKHGVVRGYSRVSADDLPWIQTHRWFLKDNGYAYRCLKPGKRDNRIVRMHREILGLEPGDPRHGDHINGDRLDNRRENLRVVTQAENNRLHKRQRKRSSSPFRGVIRPNGRPNFQARAVLDGKFYGLGSHADAEDAARAVNEFWVAHGYDAPNDVTDARELGAGQGLTRPLKESERSDAAPIPLGASPARIPDPHLTPAQHDPEGDD
jgi:hypothetical protein